MEPVESMQALNPIFATMDEMQDVLQGWEAPRLVVIGNQSHGAWSSPYPQCGDAQYFCMTHSYRVELALRPAKTQECPLRIHLILARIV